MNPDMSENNLPKDPKACKAEKMSDLLICSPIERGDSNPWKEQKYATQAELQQSTGR
jgi:hypothetical protein